MLNVNEIIALKKKLRITNKALSERTGVPLITIAKIMSGKTENPRRETLLALEAGLLPDSVLRDSVFPEGRTSRVLRDPGALPTHEQEDLYTYEDYLRIPEGQNVELMEGRLYSMSSPSWVHSSIVDEFCFQMQSQIRSRNGNCIARQGPVDVKLDVTSDRQTVVVPDFFILCDRSKITPAGLSGAPDFILEVLSPATRHLDIGNKMVLYRAFGVREYWIIDPENKRLILFNFMDEKENPIILPLAGKKGLFIYDGEIEADLDAIREVMN